MNKLEAGHRHCYGTDSQDNYGKAILNQVVQIFDFVVGVDEFAMEHDDEDEVLQDGDSTKAIFRPAEGPSKPSFNFQFNIGPGAYLFGCFFCSSAHQDVQKARPSSLERQRMRSDSNTGPQDRLVMSVIPLHRVKG